MTIYIYIVNIASLIIFTITAVMHGCGRGHGSVMRAHWLFFQLIHIPCILCVSWDPREREFPLAVISLECIV